MKKITLAILLFSIVIKAQNPMIIKDVTSSLYPSGNSLGADLNYAKWNGKVFYSGSGSNILCVTDGTTAGTMGISSLGGTTNISAIIPAQDFVYVVTTDITFSPSVAYNDKIWKSDGTIAGTSLVYTFPTAPGFSNTGVYYSVSGHKKNYSLDGNTLYFSAYDATNGKELWKTDGTPAGTFMLKDIKVGTGSNQASGFCKIPNTTLFIGQSVGFESKLWKTDGTSAGTEQIPVAEPFYIVNQDMAKLGDKVIFFAHNTVDGYEPYVSDGTAAGTFMLKNINPTGNSLTTQAMGLHLKIAGNYCYFIANNGSSNALWRTDGTKEGTIEVIPNVTNGISDTGYSATDSKNIWFINYQGNNTLQQLYKSNGTVSGSTMVHSTLNLSQNLTIYKGAAWFQARDIGSNANAEVWRSDGTQNNTALALDIEPTVVSGLGYSSNPIGFFELNDKLYFWGKGNNNNKNYLYQFTGDYTFNGSADTSWNNKNNWNSLLLPISTDAITIPVGKNVTIIAEAFANNAVINGNLNLVSANLNILGNINLGAKITLNSNNLNLKGAASSVSGNASKYIVTNGTGTVKVENVDATRGTIFLPIGTITNYNPVSFSNSGTSDTFSVRVSDGISGTTNGAVNATWEIAEAVAGGSNVNLNLGWNQAQENGTFVRNTAKIGHFVSGNWMQENSGAVSGSNPYTLSGTGISSFSPFSVMNFSALSVSDFNESKVAIYPNPSNGEFTIQVSDSFIDCKATIYNLLGQKLQEFKVNQNSQNHNLNKGIYLIELTKEGKKETKKLIVN
jgi:ELWxxDGT repeat protein